MPTAMDANWAWDDASGDEPSDDGWTAGEDVDDAVTAQGAKNDSASHRPEASDGTGSDEWIRSSAPDPAGVAGLAAMLRAAATAPATPDTMMALARLDPESAPAVSLIHGILACQRLMSWGDAVQQILMAALARPGVAVAMERVIDAARWNTDGPGPVCGPDRFLDAAQHPDTDPTCATVLADHAARFAALEVAAALHLSPLTGRARVDRARYLVDQMPRTLAAQRTGEIDPLRTRILADITEVLPSRVRGKVEAHALSRGFASTPSQLRAQLTRTILRIDPDGAAERARAARRRRDVYSRPEPHDLATVNALMAADKAATVMWLLNTMADAAAGSQDPRGVGERRVDALTDIIDDLVTTGIADLRPLIGSSPVDRPGTMALPHPTGPGTAGPDTASGTGIAIDTASTSEIDAGSDAPSGHVPPVRTARCDRYRLATGSAGHGSGRSAPGSCLTVYVTAGTLAGSSDMPAELAGYGPITAELARTLASRATSVRCVPATSAPPSGPPVGPTSMADDPPRCEHPGCAGDDVCGSTLDRGHEVYRPPQKVADYVLDRDRTCRFPGCRMPAARCDLDHQIPYGEGGSTCPCNLRPLCRAHHLAKTFAGWTPIATPDGTLTWTSPLGLIYTDPPDTPMTRLLGEPETTDTTPPTRPDDPPPF